MVAAGRRKPRKTKIRVLIEGEPAWFQMNMENSTRAGERLEEFDYYYTTGLNIGTERSPAPTAGKTWRRIFCPHRIDAIRFEPHTGGGAVTTVTRWQTNKLRDLIDRAQTSAPLALRPHQVRDQRSDCSKSLARADPDFRGRSKRSGLSPSHRNAQ
jgi:hypothetical protein